ncbi:MAG: TetR/AcrR family transcriptional regulator [Candidatus Bipolaricaulia bacterium]
MPDSPDPRAQVRDAALRVFARKGYDNAVVEDVADEAGVAKGTVYLYFDRKEELLGSVFHGLMNELRTRRTEIMESNRPPLDKVRVLHRAFADIFRDNNDLARVMLDIWVAGMQDPERFGIEFDTLYAEHRALVRGLLKEAQRRGEVREDLPALTPAILVGAIEGLLLQWALDPASADFPKATDEVVDVLYRGGLGHSARPTPNSSNSTMHCGMTRTLDALLRLIWGTTARRCLIGTRCVQPVL